MAHRLWGPNLVEYVKTYHWKKMPCFEIERKFLVQKFFTDTFIGTILSRLWTLDLISAITLGLAHFAKQSSRPKFLKTHLSLFGLTLLSTIPYFETSNYSSTKLKIENWSTVRSPSIKLGTFVLCNPSLVLNSKSIIKDIWRTKWLYDFAKKNINLWIFSAFLSFLTDAFFGGVLEIFRSIWGYNINWNLNKNGSYYYFFYYYFTLWKINQA